MRRRRGASSRSSSRIAITMNSARFQTITSPGTRSRTLIASVVITLSPAHLRNHGGACGPTGPHGSVHEHDSYVITKFMRVFFFDRDDQTGEARYVLSTIAENAEVTRNKFVYVDFHHQLILLIAAVVENQIVITAPDLSKANAL